MVIDDGSSTSKLSSTPSIPPNAFWHLLTRMFRSRDAGGESSRGTEFTQSTLRYSRWTLTCLPSPDTLSLHQSKLGACDSLNHAYTHALGVYERLGSSTLVTETTWMRSHVPGFRLATQRPSSPFPSPTSRKCVIST